MNTVHEMEEPTYTKAQWIAGGIVIAAMLATIAGTIVSLIDHNIL
jgi:hypothetical protein